jgi:hypothetical protein
LLTVGRFVGWRPPRTLFRSAAAFSNVRLATTVCRRDGGVTSAAAVLFVSGYVAEAALQG